MEPFNTFQGKIASLDRANVDTDQIIPKQFLKSIKRTGFGENLFFDWRYLPNNDPDPEFELNKPEFQGATILVTRNNFGCGSSREHAVWAIKQYGFRVVVAPWKEHDGSRIPGFADIFRNNSVKNGLLTIEISPDEVDEIFEMVDRFPGLEATVDLEEQRVVLHLDEEIAFHFDIEESVKEHLLRGLDDIALTMEFEDDISKFEEKHGFTGVPA